jgi:hypothetical protein
LWFLIAAGEEGWFEERKEIVESRKNFEAFKVGKL